MSIVDLFTQIGALPDATPPAKLADLLTSSATEMILVPYGDIELPQPSSTANPPTRAVFVVDALTNGGQNAEVIYALNYSNGVYTSLTRAAESFPGGCQQNQPVAHAAGVDVTPILSGGVVENFAQQVQMAAAIAVETTRAETAEATKAPLASPALTGTPTAPTATALTDSTQIATTAYTDSAVAVEKTRAEAAEALLAPLASPALTGTPTAPTPSSSDDTTKIATTAMVQGALAPISSAINTKLTTEVTGQKIYTQATAPTSPNVGDIWVPTAAATPSTFGALAINDPYLAFGESGSMIEPYPIRWAAATITVANGYLYLTKFVARYSLTVSNFLNDGVRAAAGQSLAQQGLYLVNADGSFTLVARTPSATNVLTGVYTEVETAFDSSLASSYAIVAGTSYATAVLQVGATTTAEMMGIYAPSLQRDSSSLLMTGQSVLPLTIASGTPGTNQSMPWTGLV